MGVYRIVSSGNSDEAQTAEAIGLVITLIIWERFHKRVLNGAPGVKAFYAMKAQLGTSWKRIMLGKVISF